MTLTPSVVGSSPASRRVQLPMTPAGRALTLEAPVSRFTAHVYGHGLVEWTAEAVDAHADQLLATHQPARRLFPWVSPSCRRCGGAWPCGSVSWAGQWAKRQAQAAAEADRLELVGCGACSTVAVRRPDGAAPAGWFFQATENRYLCPRCRQGAVDVTHRWWTGPQR